MDWQAIATSVGSILAAALLLAIIRLLRHLIRANDAFREDWYGTPARPGREAVPGVPERLGRIEKELHPNGGGTLRDSVNRLEERLGRVESMVLRSPSVIATLPLAESRPPAGPPLQEHR